MEQIEKSNNSRNDPVDPSSRSSRQSRTRGARPFRTHLYDSLTQIRESALATDDDDDDNWTSTNMMEDEQFSVEYDNSPNGADAEDANRCASGDGEDHHHDDASDPLDGSLNGSPVSTQKRSSQQANLVSTASHHSAEDDGELGSGRLKKMNKMKLLVRSHALREAASPPPDSPCASPTPHCDADESADVDDQLEHQQQQDRQQHPHQAPLVITVVESHDDASSLQPEAAQAANRLRPRVQVESSQCSVDSSSSFVSFSLSRDSSTELANSSSNSDVYIGVGSHMYTDNTGVDLQRFIVETLHRNYKDRMTLLRIEQDMIALVRDTKRTCHRFPAMSSYHRMLVHRVAAYFGMEHNVDQSGNCVVVSKSRHTRLPEVAFKEYVRDDIVLPEEPSRKLNPKREAVSFDEVQRTNNKCGRSPETRSRSLEERDVGVDAMQMRPRNRAFQPQVTWVASTEAISTGSAPIMGARSKESLTDSAYPPSAGASRNTSEDSVRWPKRFSQAPLRNNRIPKVESFDSRDLLCSYGNSLRPTVAKSYSFGGYTATTTSDAEVVGVQCDTVANGTPAVYQQSHLLSQAQNQNYGSRFLSKQDSNSSSISISRSSPTSSGYKSQQSAAPSPTPVPYPRAPFRAHAVPSCGNVDSPAAGFQEWNRGSASTMTTTSSGGATAASDIVSTTPANTSLLWAVTSLDAVPPGSILINPQTGQPFYNADGSAYRYDPKIPLPFQVDTNGIDNNGSNNDPAAEAESVEASYEPYDRQEASVSASVEDSETAAVLSTAAAAPVYATWPHQQVAHQHCYESAMSPSLNATSHYASQQGQPYFGADYASFQTSPGAVTAPTSHSNGYIIAPTVNAAAASFDDAMKATNCVAVPVAQGHGYVLYQTCLGPPADGGTTVDANELYAAMKNLSLRPINAVPHQMSYNPSLADGLAHQPEIASTTPFIAALPIRPTNVPNVKMHQPTCTTLPSRSGATPPTVTTGATTAPFASNAYLASVRVPTSSQMVHHQVQPYNGTANLVSPYPMVYPVVNTASHQQVSRQHYFPSGLVHQFNNTQYVSAPWSLVTAPTAGANRCTPERETPVSVDMSVNRMVTAPHSPNQRLSCLYGPSLPSPFLTGDCGGMRHPSTVLHRQFSLPTSSPSTIQYTLRPRIQQQQLTLPSPSMPRPVTAQNQSVYAIASTRNPRTRRQVLRTQHPSGAGQRD